MNPRQSVINAIGLSVICYYTQRALVYTHSTRHNFYLSLFNVWTTAAEVDQLLAEWVHLVRGSCFHYEDPRTTITATMVWRCMTLRATMDMVRLKAEQRLRRMVVLSVQVVVRGAGWITDTGTVAAIRPTNCRRGATLLANKPTVACAAGVVPSLFLV
jgi:hypothetical protein